MTPEEREIHSAKLQKRNEDRAATNHEEAIAEQEHPTPVSEKYKMTKNRAQVKLEAAAAQTPKLKAQEEAIAEQDPEYEPLDIQIKDPKKVGQRGFWWHDEGESIDGNELTPAEDAKKETAETTAAPEIESAADAAPAPAAGEPAAPAPIQSSPSIWSQIGSAFKKGFTKFRSLFSRK